MLFSLKEGSAPADDDDLRGAYCAARLGLGGAKLFEHVQRDGCQRCMSNFCAQKSGKRTNIQPAGCNGCLLSNRHWPAPKSSEDNQPAHRKAIRFAMVGWGTCLKKSIR